MNWRDWAYGLVGAIIGGAANSIVVMAIDPMQFNFGEGLGKLGTVAGVAALVSGAMFLKQSPLPKVNEK